MLFKPFTFLGIASVAIAHGSHDQEPMEGPHQSLWYNTLPGDGGTQVRPHISRLYNIALTVLGRLCLLRYQHLWSPPLSALSRTQQHQI